MVVSNKKRGLTSKSRAVTNKRGTLYPKKMLAGDGCKYRTNEFDTHHLRKLRSNKTQTMQHIFIELHQLMNIYVLIRCKMACFSTTNR